MRMRGVPRSVTDAVGFYMVEAERVHAAFDNIGIPRYAEGEKLSMSQRAGLMSREVEKLAAQAARLDARVRKLCGPS